MAPTASAHGALPGLCEHRRQVAFIEGIRMGEVPLPQIFELGLDGQGQTSVNITAR